MAKCEDKDLKILESEKKQDPSKLKGGKLHILLLWHQVTKKDIRSKPQKLVKWIELVDNKLPIFARWIEEDEFKLSELKEKKIDIGHGYWKVVHGKDEGSEGCIQKIDQDREGGPTEVAEIVEVNENGEDSR